MSIIGAKCAFGKDENGSQKVDSKKVEASQTNEKVSSLHVLDKTYYPLYRTFLGADAQTIMAQYKMGCAVEGKRTIETNQEQENKEISQQTETTYTQESEMSR